MKKLLLLVFLALMSFSVDAQQLPIKVFVGGGISDITNADDSKSKLSYRVGVGTEFYINEYLAIQPSLMFTTKGAKGKMYYEDEDGNDYSKSETWNPAYLQLPVKAAYKYTVSDNMNLFVNAGPYLAYCVSKDEDKFDYEEGDSKVRSFEFGMSFGIGAEYEKFFAEFSYETSFTDVAKDISSKNYGFFLSIGYCF